MERRSDELFIVLISLFFFCTLMKNLWKLWSIISLPVCIGVRLAVSKSHRSPCMQSYGQLGWHVESFDFGCGVQKDGEAASQGSLIISTMYLHNDHPWVSHISVSSLCMLIFRYWYDPQELSKTCVPQKVTHFLKVILQVLIIASSADANSLYHQGASNKYCCFGRFFSYFYYWQYISGSFWIYVCVVIKHILDIDHVTNYVISCSCRVEDWLPTSNWNSGRHPFGESHLGKLMVVSYGIVPWSSGDAHIKVPSNHSGVIIVPNPRTTDPRAAL